MPKGKPSKWIEIKVDEFFYIGKRGIQIKVWKKHEHSKRGLFYVSVGGLSWREHEKKKWKQISWDELEQIFMEK